MVAQRRSSHGRLVASLLLALFATLLPGHAVRAATTFTVDTTADDLDANPGDFICATAAGKCSLRAAVQTVDALGYGNTIVIPAGTYTLSRPYDANDLTGAFGDLDIVGSQTIKGAGSGKTIIQQAGATANDAVDRVFDIRTNAAVVSFTGLTIRNGKGVNFGGGIDVSATAVLNLTDVSLKGNRAQSGAGLYGAGQLNITGSTFSANVASFGSAINWSGNVNLRTSTVSGNTSTSPGGSGALRFNRVPGAVGGTFLIDRSLISGNTAPIAAAGLFGEGSGDRSNAIIRNSTVTGNTATDAGATVLAVVSPAQLDFESATVALNNAPVIKPAVKSDVTALSSIFAGNGAKSCLAPLTSKGHNLDAGSSCGFGGNGDLENVSPKLGSLASNGGPTKTLALGGSSPAIDAGASCPTVDQRGSARPKDGNGDGVKACDIGAYEHATVSALPPSPTPEITPAPSPTPEITAAPTTEPTIAGETTAPPPSAPTSAAPGASGSAATSAASPVPVSDGSTGGDVSWIVLVLIVVIVAVLAFVALRRRRPSGASPA
jgi:CSLREA domain-containing protein